MQRYTWWCATVEMTSVFSRLLCNAHSPKQLHISKAPPYRLLHQLYYRDGYSVCSQWSPVFLISGTLQLMIVVYLSHAPECVEAYFVVPRGLICIHLVAPWNNPPVALSLHPCCCLAGSGLYRVLEFKTTKSSSKILQWITTFWTLPSPFI